MMTITLNNNVVLYEGVISNEQNEQFLRELNKSLKSFSAEITGGSFLKENSGWELRLQKMVNLTLLGESWTPLESMIWF